MSRWRDRIRISGGFWLLAAWFTLVNGWQLLAVILSAAALHELGHLLVLRLLGARVRELRVSVFGAELMTSAARLSYPGRSRAGAGGASSESAVRAGSGGRPRLGGGGSPSVTVPLQPAAGAAPGRRPGAVSRGRMAGGSLRRGAHRLLGGGHDGAGPGRPGAVADRADRREPVAAAGCIRPAGGGPSGTARQKGEFFVKNTCIFLLAVVSYYGYKGWSSAVHTPECVDVPLREAA